MINLKMYIYMLRRTAHKDILSTGTSWRFSSFCQSSADPVPRTSRSSPDPSPVSSSYSASLCTNQDHRTPRPQDPNTLYQDPIKPNTIYQEPINHNTTYHGPINPNTIYMDPINQYSIYQDPINPNTMYQDPITPNTIYQDPRHPDPKNQGTLNPNNIYQEPINQEPINHNNIYQEPINHENANPIYHNPICQGNAVQDSVAFLYPDIEGNNYTAVRRSALWPSRYRSRLMPGENRPLEVGLLRKVKEVLVDVEPRTAAQHITRADCKVLSSISVWIKLHYWPKAQTSVWCVLVV